MSLMIADSWRPLGTGRHAPAGALRDTAIADLVASYKRDVAGAYQSLPPDAVNRLPAGAYRVSTKLDGEQWCLHHDAEGAILLSPTGRAITGIPLTNEAHACLGDWCGVLAGELYAMPVHGRPNVYDLHAALGGGPTAAVDRLRFAAFDLVRDGEMTMLQHAAAECVARLASLLPATGTVHHVAWKTCANGADIAAYYHDAVTREGAEGIVIHRPDGRISKVKPQITLDAVVVGYTAQQGGVTDLLLSLMTEEGHHRLIGHVDVGFSEDERHQLAVRLSTIPCGSALSLTNRRGRPYQWVCPTLVIEVQCHELLTSRHDDTPVRRWALTYQPDAGWRPLGKSASFTLRHAVYLRIRDDKSVTPHAVRWSQVTELVPITENTASASPLPTSTIIRREVYNAIFARVKAKGLTVDPRHTLSAIERIEAIDDQEYLNLLRAYAQGRPGDTEAFLQAALARKQSLRADFEGFYRTVLGDKQFSFARMLPPKSMTTSVLPKHLEEAMSEIVDRESWQGITIPFDTDMVEDVQLHVCTEQVAGRRGKVDQRTVYRLKMRPEKQQQILNVIAQAQQGKITAPEVGNPLAEDAFYTRILDGVRSVNGHLEHGSTRFNATKLSQALACEPELRALLRSDRIELRDMAEYYLKAIDELTIYQRGGVTPSGRVSQLDMFRVRPGRISEIGKAGGPLFKVAEGPARLDQRSIANGRITLKGTEKRPGQLFGGDRSQKLPKTGTQYTLEFDDGTVIRVRPFSTDSYSEHAIKPGQNYFAIAGDIEVIVPGKGTPEQVAQTFEKLRKLGIPAEVAPPEYQEYLYLHQVAVANNLQAGDAGYRQLLQRLESRDAPVTERVEALVQYWNARLKVKDIRKLSRYNPLGEYQFDTQQGGGKPLIGYRRLSRFDLDVDKEMRGYNLMHQVVGGSSDEYVKMVDLALTHNGSLLSTTEKLRSGVKPGGMSPEADMGSGGANYVFTRWRPDPRGNKSFREMGFYGGHA